MSFVFALQNVFKLSLLLVVLTVSFGDATKVFKFIMILNQIPKNIQKFTRWA